MVSGKLICTQGITDEKKHDERASTAEFPRFRGRKMPACVLFGRKLKKRPNLDS